MICLQMNLLYNRNLYIKMLINQFPINKRYLVIFKFEHWTISKTDMLNVRGDSLKIDHKTEGKK